MNPKEKKPKQSFRSVNSGTSLSTTAQISFGKVVAYIVVLSMLVFISVLLIKLGYDTQKSETIYVSCPEPIVNLSCPKQEEKKCPTCEPQILKEPCPIIEKPKTECNKLCDFGLNAKVVCKENECAHTYWNGNCVCKEVN